MLRIGKVLDGGERFTDIFFFSYNLSVFLEIVFVEFFFIVEGLKFNFVVYY